MTIEGRKEGKDDGKSRLICTSIGFVPPLFDRLFIYKIILIGFSLRDFTFEIWQKCSMFILIINKFIYT